MQDLTHERFYLGIYDPQNDIKILIHDLFHQFYATNDEDVQVLTEEMAKFLIISLFHVHQSPNLRGVNDLVRAVFKSMSRYRDNPVFKQKFQEAETEELFDRMAVECDQELKKFALLFKRKIFYTEGNKDGRKKKNRKKKKK